MKDAAASLDRLHGLEPPPEISWWPLAPGWYAVGAFLFCAVALLCFWSWKKWRANAYRRVALRELELASDTRSVAEVLRRVGLMIAPRSTIAALSGRDWVEWLSKRGDEPMPGDVRNQLLLGVYDPGVTASDCEPLKSYARQWISSHCGETT